MKKITLLCLFILIAGHLFAQGKPKIGFEELLMTSEENNEMIKDARLLTAQLDIPHSIYLPEGIFIEARGVENGRVVYVIYNDLVNIYNDGETAFWEVLNDKFDLSQARLHFVNKPTQNPELGYPEVKEPKSRQVNFLMVMESTNDRAMSFDTFNGDLINAAFTPSDPVNLATPNQIRLSPRATLTVSDQLSDGVFEYDTLGNFISLFAPAGGINNNILDNIRGHNYRNRNLYVTVAAGANLNSIAEFDTAGNYVGNFIANGSGGLDSPWDILFRTNDVLVTASLSDAIHQYDLNGNPIGIFATVNTFPWQLVEFDNGNIAYANSSGSSGVWILSATGDTLNFFNAVTGNRGVYQLGNGNILTTNGTGVYELDGTTGVLIRTIVSGVSARYISPYDLSIVPVELTSFTANVVDQVVVLNWTTATEVNNQGFEILRSAQNDNDWQKIGYVPGFGTTTEPKSYSYTDQSVNNGIYYYRLKQIDFDGSFTFSGVVEAEVSLPTIFSLEQNYPNPFNPSTSIQFSLPVDARITIKIYNLVGENVAEVVSSNFAAGSHKVDFNANTLTSGIYFYQLEATGIDGNTFSSIRKMTLLK